MICSKIWILASVIVSAQSPGDAFDQMFDDLIDELLAFRRPSYPYRVIQEGSLAANGPEVSENDPEVPENDLGVIGGGNVLGVPNTFPRLFEAMLGPILVNPNALFPALEELELPKVTLLDDQCLVSVDLKNLKANETTFDIFSDKEHIILEIRQTRHSEGLTSMEDGASKSILRGHLSQMTAVRSFPAPRGCNMTNNESKATIDDEGNKLLIKFPKILESLEMPAKTENTEDNATETSAGEKHHWWQGLFGGTASHTTPAQTKVPVPLVKYDEF